MAQYVNYEILRQAGAATVDQPTKSLGMELIKQAGKYAKNAKAKADKIKAQYPEGINVPKVDADIRPGLIKYLENSKQEYDKAAKQLSLLPSWSPGYKKARDTINRIKDGYANVEKDLSTLQANRTAASKIEPGHGATNYEVAKNSDLVNGDYATYDIQFSDQGVTYMDGQERKSVADFMAAPAADGVGAKGQATLYNKVVSDAKNKVVWDETDQRANIDTFIDGMNNTQLKNWMFNGPRSYGYTIALNNLKLQEYPVIEEEDSADVKKQKQETIDLIDAEIDRLKYSDDLKGEKVRDELYDALKEAYNKNIPIKDEGTKDLNATLDGSSYVKVSQARNIANQMSKKGNVAYTGSKVYKFDTLDGNMIQMYRYDDNEDVQAYVKYNPNGGTNPVSLNEALSFRGIGQEFTGLNFESTKQGGFDFNAGVSGDRPKGNAGLGKEIDMRDVQQTPK